MGPLSEAYMRIQELEKVGQRGYLTPSHWRPNPRIQELQAAYPSDPSPIAAELIEAYTALDQARRDYDALLADVQHRLRDMMTRLAAVAPGAGGER